MKKFACRYAVVQFLPHTETGEFANAGIVIACPETGHFGFKLQTRKYARVSAFFDELPRHVYRHALQLIRGELEHVAGLIANAPIEGRSDFVRQVFDSLTHPREAMIRFGSPRALLAADPEGELLRLFDHYVDRAFATQEYVEQAIERRLKTLLSTLPLIQPFRPVRVGDDEVYARFPFVQKRGDAVTKIIKPFNLQQGEPMGIFDHGDAWLQKMRRLRKRNLLPNNVLFAVAGPPEGDTKRFAAFQEICTELQAEEVQMVNESAQERIADFALA